MPTITITNVFISADHEPSIRYTLTIPRKDGSSVLYGTAKLDEEIELPVIEQ